MKTNPTTNGWTKEYQYKLLTKPQPQPTIPKRQDRKKKNVDLVFVAKKRPKIATSKLTAYSAITTIFVNETIVYNKFTVKLLQLKIHKNHHLIKFFFL